LTTCSGIVKKASDRYAHNQYQTNDSTASKCFHEFAVVNGAFQFLLFAIFRSVETHDR